MVAGLMFLGALALFIAAAIMWNMSVTLHQQEVRELLGSDACGINLTAGEVIEKVNGIESAGKFPWWAPDVLPILANLL
jgi:hypothetical protein